MIQTAPRELVINRILRMVSLVFALVGGSLAVISLVIGLVSASLFMLGAGAVVAAGSAGLLEIYMRNFFFMLEEEMEWSRKRGKGIEL